MRKVATVIYGLLVLALIGLSTSSCLQFLGEGAGTVQTFASTAADPANAILLKLQIVETNLAREQMRIQVTPTVTGRLAAGSPRLPSRDLELTLATVNGPRIMLLKRDHHLEPFDIDIALSDGDILLYPMDRYAAWIEAEALVMAGNAPSQPVPPQPASDVAALPIRGFLPPPPVPAAAAAQSGPATSDHVAVVIAMNTRNHAVHVVPRLGPETDAGDTVVQLQITRPAAIRAFSWFMVAIMGVISLSVVLAVVAVITGRRRAELSMLGWSTALLFALPAVRNNLPGAPPLGALIDYSVFFWAEALVGLSMIMLLAFWFSVKETPD